MKPVRRRSKTPQKKRHFTERFGYPVVIRWTIAKGAYIGFLTGLGYSSAEIEKRMADGTSAATVRRQWKNWGLPLHEVGGPKHRRISVNLTFHERAKLARQAKKRGLTGEEYLRRINVCAIRDDMYDAITDGEFD
ncbi:MAG: hypothetical protein E5X34_13150 [Mesorhizobium sp.]|uniref:hypothetical protein n=1 Tax=Mesorhizobium sp. TaxID=1871066 RepID=UPI0011F9E588|nr:hypothetical protein [Mesorhizobium sp.]TIR23996.1 MAG: hypothetical protein E5X34_13150 [Mesorhizobium sp.]